MMFYIRHFVFSCDRMRGLGHTRRKLMRIRSWRASGFVHSGDGSGVERGILRGQGTIPGEVPRIYHLLT